MVNNLVPFCKITGNLDTSAFYESFNKIVDCESKTDLLLQAFYLPREPSPPAIFVFPIAVIRIIDIINLTYYPRLIRLAFFIK